MAHAKAPCVPAPLRLLCALRLLAICAAVREDEDAGDAPQALLQSERNECDEEGGHYYKAVESIGSGAYGQVHLVVKTDKGGEIVDHNQPKLAMKLFASTSHTLSIQQMEQAWNEGKDFNPKAFRKDKSQDLINFEDEMQNPHLSGISSATKDVLRKAIEEQNKFKQMTPEELGNAHNAAIKKELQTLKGDMRAYEQEGPAMEAASKCSDQGMVKMIDRKPCLQFAIAVQPEDGTPPQMEMEWQRMPGYVMNFIEGTDLRRWSRDTAKLGKGKWNECFNPEHENGLFKSLAEQLACFHGQGWVHQDLKADNVFLGKDGQDGCPTSIHLGDPGIAEKTYTLTGTLTGTFPESSYDRCNHMVDSVFEMYSTGQSRAEQGVPDSLVVREETEEVSRDGKKRQVFKYKVVPDIDWCAFITMWEDTALVNWAVENKFVDPNGLKIKKSFNYPKWPLFVVDTASWLKNNEFIEAIPHCGLMGGQLGKKRWLRVSAAVSDRNVKWLKEQEGKLELDSIQVDVDKM